MKKIILTTLLLAIIAIISPTNADAKTLKVATNAEFEPYEFIKNGKYVGFDIDLMSEIAKKIGAKVEYQNMEFDGVVGAVLSNTCDLSISGLTITPKRAKTVAFSIPYINAAQFIIIRTDDKTITGKTKAEIDKQIEGKKIGVVTGFTGQKYVTGEPTLNYKKIKGAKAVVFDNVSLAVSALRNKGIDLIVMDDVVAQKVSATAANKKHIKTIEIPLTVEKYAIAINKKNTALKADVDKALNTLIKDGTVKKLLAKWDIR
ncbi:MAG: transporter substrate-binding domain-containing protein [Synergistaceae bacterium]